MDGGYYAIKGFEFQVDKTLLEILNSSSNDEEIQIERIQDINSNSFVMQVKYKETQKFYPSSIKSPLKQLIDEFKKDSTKEYLLYCYFDDMNGYDENISVNNILGDDKNKYSASDRIKFNSKFKLQIAPDFQTQFSSVINKLITEGLATNEDEAIFCYSNLVDYLRKIVVKNPPGKEHKRICTKKELIDLVRSYKKIVFDSSYLEFRGRLHYFKHIKSKFHRPRKNLNNLIIFGNVEESSSLKIEELVSQLISKYYTKANYDIKPLEFVRRKDTKIS